MKNIKIYLENGQVIITSAVAASSKLNSSINNAPSVNTYPSNGALTASIVNTNEIKVVNSNGTVVLNNIPFAKLVGKDGTTAIGANAAAVLSDLNSTSYFGALPIEPKVAANKSAVESEAAKVLALKNSTKTDTGDRGVFVNDGKATTSSHVSVKTSDSAIQAGTDTAIKLNEVGKGIVTLSVQAGTTGNKSSVDAITITGNSGGTSALTTFNETVEFDGTVTGLTSTAIPNLSASKITSGTFTTTRIPSLNASKIGSGTLGDARVAASNVTQHEASLSITESQISNLQAYLTDYTVIEGDVTAHQAALSITESQISDLSHYTNASVDTHLNQSGAGSGQYLKWTGTDYAWGTVSSGGLGNIVEDTSPQLGADLDVNGFDIQSNGNVTVQIDADNNTSLSKFQIKNGAGNAIYTIDEEGTTIATTGASSNIKIGNLDGGLGTFNGISLNNDLTYPGIVGFAGGSSSNDNFFCFGVVLDFRPDGVAGGLRMVKDSSGDAMVTINKGDSSTAPTTHTLYVGGNGKFEGNLDAASGIDVTGNITVTGTVDGIDIATDVAANTAKTSFPGFGTTAGTALAGNTSLFDGAYGSLSGTPSTFAPSSHNHAASEITSGTFSTARIPSLAASKITSGTLANARISEGSVTQHQAALSVTESQISDLQSYLTTVPAQSFASLTGKPTTVAGYGITDAFASLAGDTSPQLGGDLDVDGNKITSNNNGDVTIDPAGTGAIVLRSDNIQFEGAGSVSMSSLKFYEASAAGSNFVAFKAALSLTSDTTWTLPSDDGTSGQVIQTNGSGTLSFATVLPQANPIMQGLVKIQELTGALPGKLKIFDSGDSHGVTLQAPDLTADVDFVLPAADGTSGQVLKTDGSGNLSFTTVSGGGTNTNIANTNLTADNNRTYDLDSNTLSFDLKEGEFVVDDTSDASYPVNIACSSGAVSILGLSYPPADGTSGQVITTDGVGNLTFSTVSGGGGMTETPFVSMSGRASFSSADEEERVLIAASFGWSFYNQTTEMGDWSSSDTINSTTYSLAAYLRAQGAMQMPSDEKKVRMKVSYRVQNGNSTDFGFSIWSGAVDNNSTASSNLTLRGASATQTVGTSSIVAYKKEFTTTSTITDDAVFLTLEQRGGGAGLSTTAYVYYNIHLFLVD